MACLCAGAEEEEAALEAEAAAIEAEAHKASVSGEAQQQRLIACAWTAHKSPDGQVSTTFSSAESASPRHHAHAARTAVGSAESALAVLPVDPSLMQ